MQNNSRQTINPSAKKDAPPQTLESLPSGFQKFRGEHASIDQGLTTLQSGFQELRKIVQEKPLVAVGIGAVVGYFSAAILFSTGSASEQSK